MTLFLVLKFLHVIGACVLLGTGAGIAFFMLVAHQTQKPAVIASVARIVVTADFVFTAAAVVIQPITGYLLMREIGYPLTEGWILASLLLYAFTGALWLPVVVWQMRLRDFAEEAVAADQPLPEKYHSLFARWYVAGFPAFAAVLTILWLMISRPSFSF